MSDLWKDWPRTVALRVLPAVAVILTAVAGVLGWQNHARSLDDLAATESVAAARDTATAMLSYRAETVDKDLDAARDRLAAPFLDSYTTLTRDHVIPGAKQKRISAQARVTGAASVSATPNHAVVLLFVDQTVTAAGAASPAHIGTSARVNLDKVGGRWLVSGFDPI